MTLRSMLVRATSVVINVVMTLVIGLMLGPTLVLLSALWLAPSWFFLGELAIHHRIGFSIGPLHDPVFVKRILFVVIAYALITCCVNLIVAATERGRTPPFALGQFGWRNFRQSVIGLLIIVTLEPYLQEIEND